mgnify:CR=1 FL=1
MQKECREMKIGVGGIQLVVQVCGGTAHRIERRIGVGRAAHRARRVRADSVRALGQRTSLPFGTAVTCPGFRYHPAVIAHAAATLGAMYPGRFWLGLGKEDFAAIHLRRAFRSYQRSV